MSAYWQTHTCRGFERGSGVPFIMWIMENFFLISDLFVQAKVILVSPTQDKGHGSHSSE